MNEKAATPKNAAALKKAQRNVYWQAGLALVTIILTLVIVFAMTSAWYTNIVQTSGLTFQAEAWGFDGNVTVNSGTIVAAPGDEGVIRLEAENESESIAAVSVNVSKALMEQEMEKRLYFYVDTQLTRNGESMERVYLNTQESYTYTLFSQGKLILNDEIHNDAQLKWQWVYDVLGYYVLGTRTADGKDVTEAEYLRPIEYDFDEATTTFEADDQGNLVMKLKTVDGETSAEDFLVALSKTDGYEGTIDPRKVLESGHYPVDVDEDGYGVYAYLCTYSEIEMATRYDTALGEAAAKGEATQTYQANLTISAQKNDDNVINVGTLAALNSAMELDTGAVLQLTSNITLTDENNLVIPKNTQAMLDLNGYAIISQSTGTAVMVNEGAYLTMINGTLKAAAENSGTAVTTVGAEAVFSNVTVTGFENGIRVADDEGTKSLDSRVRLVNCQVDAAEYAVYVKGNGSDSEHNTQLIVEGCTITSDLVGIGGNGGGSSWGTDIQVISSTVTGNAQTLSAGIYHPQKDSSLTIYNSTVSGYTGVIIKGGSVSVNGSKVTGTGEYQQPAENGSGSSDTGDGIYIETNYGFDILLEISGASVINSTHGYSLEVYEAHAENVSVMIYSGSFKEEQPDEYIAEGSVKTGTIVVEQG